MKGQNYLDEGSLQKNSMTKLSASFAVICVAFLIGLCAFDSAFADAQTGGSGVEADDSGTQANAQADALSSDAQADQPTDQPADPDAFLLTHDGSFADCTVTLTMPETADNSALSGFDAPLSAAPDTLSDQTPTTLSFSGYYFAKLNNGELNYTDSTIVTQQFVSEDGNGVFFLNNAQLSFYSLDTGAYTSVYNFGSCSSAYEANGLLYVLTGNTTCQIYDLAVRKITGTLQIQGMNNATAVGADSQGRIYVAGTSYDSSSKLIYPVQLYSSGGNLLSEMENDALVYAFSGFESDTGRFFMETYYNWTYWGYSHPGRAATMGVVTNNVIESFAIRNTVVVDGVTYTLNCIDYLCQNYYYLHQGGSALIGDKYFVTASTTFGRVQIVDAENLTIVADLGRAGFEYTASDDTLDVGSIGVRTVYNEAHNSIIFYENSHALTEYSMETGEVLNAYTTQYNVFNLLMQDGVVYAVEKENNAYYLEVIDWRDPTSIKIEAQNTTLKVGETETLTVDEEGSFLSGIYNWTSSDDAIVTVTSTGRIAAWKEGTAKITAVSKNGLLSDTVTITVVDSGQAVPKAKQQVAGGLVSDTASDNNYTVWSSPMYSAMYQSDSGTLVRVECTNDGANGAVLVEEWSLDGALLSSSTLPAELPIYGGFYCGADYNFLVFGQSNPDESDNCEVMRVVKYSKNWERLGACSVYGANTYIPFDAGSLRMTEAGSNLYIHTCHEMYDTDGSGTHHQANMTFVINTSSMSVQQSYYDVMNISQAGYVSHSFNQFVKTDGTYLYRIDHGDAYPRAVSVIRSSLSGSITDVSYTYALSILGSTSANATGVSVGGFELSTDNCIVAGNSVDQSNSSTYSASGQRNIFVSITDKSLADTNIVWLTDYSAGDGITPRTPQLVKLDDEHFLVMWEEVNSATNKTTTRLATINSEGVKTQNVSTKLRLSDCQPVVTTDGNVRWYVTDGDNATLYSINPYRLGDISSVVTFERFGGDTRYDTSRLINAEVADSAPYAGVIVCSAANGKFADALCAAGLSGMLNYPLVLVSDSTTSLDAEARESIEMLFAGGQGDVIIIGGESSVSPRIMQDLREYDTDANVERYAGTDRYETACEVYNLEIGSGEWDGSRIVVAKGNDFPDALGVAAFCAAQKTPIMLTNTAESGAEGYILSAARNANSALIVGGEASVSADKEAAISRYTPVERVSGDNRYTTSLALCEWELNHGMDASVVGIATGATFPDALGSSFLLSQTKSVLVLAAPAVADNAGLFDFIDSYAGDIRTVKIFGGVNSVSSDIETTLDDLLNVYD